MTRRISRHFAIAAGLVVAVLLGCIATPSWAQRGREGGGQMPYNDPRTGSSMGNYTPPSGNPDRDASRYDMNFRTVTPSRVLTRERLEYEAVDLERRRRRMGPNEIRADITFQLERAGVACGLSNFKRVGMTPEAQSIYETACNGGPGYVLVNGVEPDATSCIVLAGAAANARRRNPNAPTGAQCTLPENQNGPQLIGSWAREAGVTCRVDQGVWLGSSDAGFDMYEVGCDGSEGFWLEKTASSWVLRGCLQVNAEGLNCRFTNAGEQRAWIRARLAGTQAQACDVAEIRMIGASSQGGYYEARCSAPGEGYLLRIARDGPAEEVTSCAELQGRATTCTLTDPRAARSEG